VVGLNLLIKPAWVLTENVVHNAVGHAAWGTYTAVFSFAFLFITLADLGINQYATKRLASEPELMRSYFPNLLSFKFLLLIAYPFLMWGTGWLWGYRGEKLYFLALLSLVHGGNQLLQFFRANFQALQRFRLDGFASIADKIILLGLTLLLLWAGIDLERFVYARLLAIGLTTIAFYVVVTRLYGWLRPRLELGLIRRLLRQSVSFALITVLYSIHDKVDQVMLERISGEVETSLYAGAYRWLDAFSMYLWLTLPIFFARMAFRLQEPETLSRLVRTGKLVTALPLTFVAVFVYFYAEKLLLLFTGSSPAQIATMARTLEVLFIALYINGLVMIYSTLLTATGHERIVNWFIVLGIALNVGLNLWLMPAYGALAAAWSTVASLGLLGLLYLGYAHYRLVIKVPFDLLGKLLLAGGGLALSFWAGGLTGWPWLIITLLAGLVYAALIGALGLIPRQFWKNDQQI
jgi:O-antigen/teichoic acid export membrane protein